MHIYENHYFSPKRLSSQTTIESRGQCSVVCYKYIQSDEVRTIQILTVQYPP